MTLETKRALTLAGVLSGLLAIAGTASAVVISGEDKTNGCHVSGFVTVHDDETHWSLKITDIEGEGYGAYAKIVIDRDNHSDNEIKSSKTDSEGDIVSFSGTKHYARSRGAKVYACVDRDRRSDTCTLIEHVDEN